MKNVNLSLIFLGMVADFGARGMEVSSIVPDGGIEPIDALISFKGCDMSTFDQHKADTIIADNITGNVLQAVVKPKEDSIELYIEFENSKFLDDLD